MTEITFKDRKRTRSATASLDKFFLTTNVDCDKCVSCYSKRCVVKFLHLGNYFRTKRLFGNSRRWGKVLEKWFCNIAGTLISRRNKSIECRINNSSFLLHVYCIVSICWHMHIVFQGQFTLSFLDYVYEGGLLKSQYISSDFNDIFYQLDVQNFIHFDLDGKSTYCYLLRTILH